MKNRSAVGLVLFWLLAAAGSALAGSTINPNVPAQNSTLSSAVVRGNFAAAYNDVTSILSGYAGTTAPGSPVVFQDWLDTSASPATWKKRYSGGWGTIGTFNLSTGVFTYGGTITCGATPAFTGDVTKTAGSCVTVLATAQPGAHTWAAVQTFTLAPVFTDASGSRTALGLGALATVTPGTGVATALAVNVGTAGSFVVNGGALGTPSSGTLTSATGLPISTGLTGAGTGVLTALGVNVGSAGAFIVNGGALGTPSSGTLTSATGLPISTGLTGAGTGVLTALGVNVGSAGAFVTFNGAGGTPSAIVLTNATGTASGLTAGNVTTNANLTGDVTSVGNATTLVTAQSGAHTWAALQTFSLGISVASAQGVSWNADTFLSRLSAGIVGVGSSVGSQDGRFAADTYRVGGGGAVTINTTGLRLAGGSGSTSVGWASGGNATGTLDAFLTSPAAATVRLGDNTGSGAAVAQTLGVQGSSGNSAAAALFTIAGSDQSGTTTTGGETRIRGGNGTSVGGAVTIYTSATSTPALAVTIAADKSVTFTAGLTLAGSSTFSTASAGPILKQGANGRVGTFVCNGVTPVTVNNTSIAISDAVSMSLNTVGGTVGIHPAIQTITASTGFTVACTAADTSTYNYAILKNAA